MAERIGCRIVRIKTEEFPEIDEEWFIYHCRTHHVDVSEEWVERRNGLSEPAPVPRCPGTQKNEIARSA